MGHIKGVLLSGLLCVTPALAQAQVQIFACEPEWAALAEEIGGTRVETYAATHARQDPHYIRARPSLVAKARNADLVFCSGAGLEVGWLPILLRRAGPDVQPQKAGHLMAADIVELLEKPLRLDRSMGDIHPQGNPHVHLDPYNVLRVAEELTQRLGYIDADHAGFYRQRLEQFSRRWRDAVGRWEAAAADLQGISLVVHHKSFSYLLNWLGLHKAAALEPKPGLAPTAAHLEQLLQQLALNPARAIILTPYDPRDAGEWLSEQTGIPLIVLPYTVAGDANSGDLYRLFERSITLLEETVHGQQ